MQLHDLLKICLLAVASRYPDSVIECNKALLGYRDFWDGTCSPHQAWEQLQDECPAFLEAQAHMVIDSQQSNIYLVDLSQDIPALWIYRDGYSPWQRSQQQRYELAATK